MILITSKKNDISETTKFQIFLEILNLILEISFQTRFEDILLEVKFFKLYYCF